MTEHSDLPATTQASSVFLLPDEAPLSPEEENKVVQWQKAMGLRLALAPYQPKDDSAEEQRFKGLTNLEVRDIRIWELATQAKPERWAVEFLQDHRFGKAVQRVETKTVHMTYQDLLHNVKEAEERFQSIVSVDAEEVKENPQTLADLL